MQSPPGRNSFFGFTLLELLVVLAIAGLLTALAPPLYSRVVPGAKLRTASLDFAIALREARSLAISSSATVDLKLIADPLSYVIGNTTAVPLPDGISVMAYDHYTTLSGSSVGKSILTADETAIHFYPDGSSNGAGFSITNGTTAYRIDVSWLTGAVTISEADDDS
jgi:general secretion pathway protein H